tara:strand:- start:2509 stop:3624 length:1116 start_codon:yes stop_codon:yes gene_type:complete
MSKFSAATATFIGTIIGAGILGIPYVVSQSGFLIGLSHIIIVGLILMLVNLYLGEIALRTPANHQLTGYASIYLGKKGKLLMFLAFAFGIYSALLAYLIGEGQSFSQLFFSNTEHTLFFALAFWLLLTGITYRGLSSLKKGEKIGVTLIIVMILAIAIKFFDQIKIENLSSINLEHTFTPFGVMIFAFLGFAALPVVERILAKDKRPTRSVIITTYIFCIFIYSIFALIVLGSLGTNTPQVATLSLGISFVILGILTMFTSYLALSFALIDTFTLDYSLSRTKAWLLTCSIPLALFFLLYFNNIASFTLVLSIGGLISGGLTAILILAMIRPAKLKGNRKPEYSLPYSSILTYILAALFILAAFLEITKLF